MRERVVFSLGQMHEEGKGVPESDSLAASWYRRAADHFSEDLGGVWEAEAQLAQMYRLGRLPKDYVEAYMWFAVVGSAVVPPTDDDMKRVAQHMTKAQIAKAQRMAEDWTRRHRRQLPTSFDGLWTRHNLRGEGYERMIVKIGPLAPPAFSSSPGRAGRPTNLPERSTATSG